MAVALDNDEAREIQPPPAGSRVMTPEKVAAIAAAAQRLRENPLFEEYLETIEEYRRVNNTVPDVG